MSFCVSSPRLKRSAYSLPFSQIPIFQSEKCYRISILYSYVAGHTRKSTTDGVLIKSALDLILNERPTRWSKPLVTATFVMDVSHNGLASTARHRRSYALLNPAWMRLPRGWLRLTGHAGSCDLLGTNGLGARAMKRVSDFLRIVAVKIYRDFERSFQFLLPLRLRRNLGIRARRARSGRVGFSGRLDENVASRNTVFLDDALDSKLGFTSGSELSGNRAFQGFSPIRE